MNPIIIIGGGLTGLGLAQALKRRKIPCIVYERDASPDSRSQGYRIRLNRLGLECLRFLVPLPIWDRIIQEAAKFYPGLGSLDAESGKPRGPGIGTPEMPCGLPAPPHLTPPVPLDDPFVTKCTSTRLPVDRKRYRDALAEDIDVVWGKALDHFENTPNGIVAHFEDGSSSPSGSLLVGCDGINSRVAQLLDLQPPIHKLGGRMIYGKAPLTPALEEEMLEVAKYGIRVCAEEISGSNLFIEVCRFNSSQGDDYVFFVLTVPSLDDLGIDDENSLDGAKITKLGIRYIRDRGYHPGLQAILKHQDPEVASMKPYLITLPNAYPTWKSHPRVTILGDAVHAVPPVGGMGGNAGLNDVRLLVEMIEQTQEWNEDTIRAYEEKAKEQALIQVKLVHAAATGSYPLVFWKTIYWDGNELDLPSPELPPST